MLDRSLALVCLMKISIGRDAMRYSDLGGLFAKRVEGRKRRARMSLAEKLDIMDELRLAAAAFKAASSAERQSPLLDHD